MTIRIPALRFGDRYDSIDQHPIICLGSKKRLGSLGLVTESMIAKDCQWGQRLDVALKILQKIPVRKRIAMSVHAADLFEKGTLDCGGDDQTPEEYLDVLTRTSGLSHVLAIGNTKRICDALRNTRAILDGLSRGLPLGIYDKGIGKQGGATVCIKPRIQALGCCMPNNSPGVHVIWLACLPFGIPVLIRPGSSEPFTPFRLIQAHIKAGYPAEVFGFYPCGYAAADRIPLLTKGAIVFGSDKTVSKWATNPLVQVHGSGFSKVMIGDDRIDDWKSLIPELVTNVAANSGRSCFTASRICVPRHGEKIANALAKELVRIAPRTLDHPNAMLSAMAMPRDAKGINQMIDRELRTGGAVDVSAKYRKGKRLVKFNGRTYLQPTVVLCNSHDHSLAKKEFLCPYTAVVEAPTVLAFAKMGPTLSLAVYTYDDELKARARESGARLVSINVATVKLDRCQPHEDPLFDLLFERKSYVE